MNLIIVEDELKLRHSLAHNMPWEDHGIEVVGLAEDGLEALQLIERKKPDLLLLDIRIPEVDGLTLAKKVHESYPYVKMIILSGHDNFSYAQKAMEYGVTKYLLKPAGDKEILQAVLEAADQLRRELEQRHDLALLKQQWSQHLPLLQNMFFVNWLNGNYDEWQLQQRAEELNLKLQENARYAVVVLEMDPLADDTSRFSEQDRPLLEFSLNSMAKELLAGAPCWLCADGSGATIGIFPMAAGVELNEGMRSIHANVERLLSAMYSFLKVSASAGISSTAGSWLELPLLFGEAGSALQTRIIYGGNIAVPYSPYGDREAHVQADANLEKGLEIALETGDSEKALRTLADIWNNIMGRADTPDMMRENVLYLSSLLVRTMQKQGWRVKEVVQNDFLFFQNLQLLTTKEQVYTWLQRVVRGSVEYVQKQRRSTNHQVVKSILAMVENELDQELTLHGVADRLYVNSSYLSKLFKRETGKAFSAFVLEHKMVRAKAALLEGSKVTDTAERVGFQDVSYFTKVFRKYWGVIPSEVKP